MKKVLLILLAFLTSIYANAFDLVVTLENEETHAKITDLDVGAFDLNFNNIAWPTLNMSDSTYVFIGLPEQPVNIMFLLGGQIAGGTNLHQPMPEMTLSLPPSVIPKKLNEVEVTARNVYMVDDMTVLVPTADEKRVSSDGASLIRNMSFSNLNVSPIDNSITTLSGDAVEKFINYLPATDADLQHIRTANVLRIETLENPSDPRFKGAHHVVNFIMIKYEYGGYTKLYGHQSFVNNTGNYNVYSKLSYRSMTYEASGGYNYGRSSHEGNVSDKLYQMPSGPVSQTEITDDSYKSSQGAYGFLKAVHQNKNHVLVNMVGATYSDIPRSWSNSSETFNSPAYQSGETHRWSTGDNFGVSWRGEYQFFLPSELSLIVTPAASYADYKSDSYYKNGNDEIVNNSSDKAWSADLSAQLSRRFGRHTVALTGYYYHNSHDLNYLGTVPSQVYNHINSGSINIDAFLNFGKISISPRLVTMFIRRNINGIVTNDNSIRPSCTCHIRSTTKATLLSVILCNT